MVSFYGNIKNNSRISFIFDKTYSSRKEMEAGCSTDGVYNGRYVLVKYGTDGKRFVPNDDNTSIIEDPEYTESAQEDWLQYEQTYDATVWLKIWSNNTEKYIMVAELNAQPPRFTTIADAPEIHDNNPHMDEYHSTITDYKIHIPLNWKINDTVNFTYNEDGFDKSQLSVITTTDKDGANTAATTYWIAEASGSLYPDHEDFLKYDYININNYKNFYVKDGDTYRLVEEDEIYSSSTDYYRKATDLAKYDENGNIVTSALIDRKRLVFDIPAIGNMMSSIWDLIYPVKWVETTVTEDTFEELKDSLYTKDEYVYIELDDESEFDDSITYYVKDSDGNRDLTISNRDGSTTIAPDTFAEIMNKLLYLFGLESDNEYKNMLNSYPRTIWGLFNAFSDLLGQSDDEVSSDNFIPVSDAGFNTYGYTSEDNFDEWHNDCFGPLYYKNDNDVFFKALEWDSTTQYYRDTNSLWALLREYQDLRDLYNPDWILDYPDSPAYIKNKPAVIVADEATVTGIDSNNYYWYVFAGENKGRLTQNLYDNYTDTLYIFDEDLSQFVEAESYSDELVYYISKESISNPTKVSIEKRWNEVQISSPNAALGEITSSSVTLAESITLADIEEAIRKVENNEI